jgi:REP element-mobilizing transposase RayT
VSARHSEIKYKYTNGYFLHNLPINIYTNKNDEYMSEKYKIREEGKAYFLTITVVNWIDIFTRVNHKLAIVDSLKYCQENKGLNLFGWCLMTNHLHLIASSSGNPSMSDILRDFKKFTSKKIVKQIIEEPESRRQWLLNDFEYAGRYLKRIKNYKLWKDGNHPIFISSPKIFYQKLDYIHKNPVKEMVVEYPEEYLFSSARNYAGRPALIEIILESPRLITY